MNNRPSDAELMSTLRTVANTLDSLNAMLSLGPLAEPLPNMLRETADRLAQPSEPAFALMDAAAARRRGVIIHDASAPAPAWEAVARNLAATVEDGAAAFVRIARAHGICEELIHPSDATGARPAPEVPHAEG